MSNQLKKKRRLDDGHNDYEYLVTFDALSTDELARIFEYLSPENIMLARLNKKMRDAATKTVVPMNRDIDNAFRVDSVRKYHTLAAMVTSLPNLQQIVIADLGVDPYNYNQRHKYNDGEDPNIVAFNAAKKWITHDIGILLNLTRLRELKIDWTLNGRYPMLFNFPLLQKLHIDSNLKYDLEMLVGLPSLKELVCRRGVVTGEIKSLRVLKDTLTKIVIGRSRGVRGNVMDLADFPNLKHLCMAGGGVIGDFDEISTNAFPALETLEIDHCQNVRGNFMNLSDIPHIKVLNLWRTNVTGDIRDIGNNDFSSLESLRLPFGVYGGCGFQFQRISDAPEVIAAVYTLMKKRPNLQLQNWFAELSEDSPDWYEPVDHDSEELPFPPFMIEFVKAGPRLGWRWTDPEDPLIDRLHHPCEINWIDPEPSKESDHFENYIHELAEIEKNFDAYKGFYQPPTEEEYRRICSSI